jgi:hypothetical protein
VADEHDWTGQGPQEFGEVGRVASEIAKRVGEPDGGKPAVAQGANLGVEAGRVGRRTQARSANNAAVASTGAGRPDEDTPARPGRILGNLHRDRRLAGRVTRFPSQIGRRRHETWHCDGFDVRLRTTLL